MTGKRLKAAPTKNTLLNLKRQLQFLEDGHNLLERKRELLTRLSISASANTGRSATRPTPRSSSPTTG